MPDITDTTKLGEPYDQPNEAVKEAVDHAEEHVDHGPADDAHDEHWTDFKYVQLFVFLVVVTAVEVALSYMVDDLGAVFLPLLLVLMAIKFFAVVLFFMHLKFDNRLFGLMFYMGLGLAIGVYLVALFTFRFFDG
jgi:cytochrome c oxidase subunit 4